VGVKASVVAGGGTDSRRIAHSGDDLRRLLLHGAVSWRRRAPVAPRKSSRAILQHKRSGVFQRRSALCPPVGPAASNGDRNANQAEGCSCRKLRESRSRRKNLPICLRGSADWWPCIASNTSAGGWAR